MDPLTPHWKQPSHATIQTVIPPSNPSDFTTKSLSKISVAPYGLFAKLDFPPCTKTDTPTYATVQTGEHEHLNLNSDLVYINHSCEPSLIFDTSPASLAIFAGPKGLQPGDELTFFYPSTEWDMAQGFDCFCGTETCRGFISGAKKMSRAQLDGLWLNAHIRSLLARRSSPDTTAPPDATEAALRASLSQAQLACAAAQKALDLYQSQRSGHPGGNDTGRGMETGGGGVAMGEGEKAGEDGVRRGITSREMSGEMGGDTK